MSGKQTYWLGQLGPRDDFGHPYGDVMYDAVVSGSSQWANMSEESFAKRGTGVLGLGHGQKYAKQPDGRWLCVDGLGEARRVS